MISTAARLPAYALAGLVASIILSGPLGSGCAAPTGPDEGAGVLEPEWGIGGKADEGGCDRAGDLCWTSGDSDVVRLVNRVENDILLDVGHAPTALSTLVDLSAELEHKLTDGERSELERLRADVADLPDDLDPSTSVAVLADINQSVLRRVRATHYAAHMIPVGRAAQRELDGASYDEGADTADADEEEDNPFYSDGMRESLRLLRDNGAMGKGYAWMLESTGVLEQDYAIMNASNFGTYDALHHRIIPLGISREEQVDRIVRHYQWAAGQVGVVAGAEGLIPIAGVPISIAHETYKLFQLHSQMAFEIAAIYGWDIREGRNLFTVSMMVMTYGTLTEVADIFASNVVIPLLARAAARRFAFTLPLQQLEKQLAQRSVALLLRIFRRQAQEQLARTALRQGASGVGRQVIGYVTVGLAVLASGAIDFAATGLVGRHVETMARRWVVDLMMDGTTFVSRPRPRDCMFQALEAMAWADDELTERESNLFMAFLGKPYRTDERTWMFLSSDERVRHSRDLSRAQYRDQSGAARSCLSREFESTMPKHRMTLLAHLYAMANVDSRESPTESAFYDQLREDLDGDGWFDGAEIDADQMNYVERSIYVLVYPGALDVAEEHREAVGAILPEDVIPYLAEPSPEVLRDFRCGTGAGCD